MSFAIVSRAGINIGADQWAFTITGDPSSGAGLKASIGSVAVQLDSSPANLFWEKTGPLQTDWSALSASGSAGVSAAASSTGAFRASSYNVPIDGVTDARGALNTLTGTTMPQTGGPYGVIIGPSETMALASNTTVPANAFIQGAGGLIKPASNVVVTLLSQPTGNAKMFDVSAGGFVVAARPMTADATWWGADLTGATDSATAVFHALAMNTISPYGTVSNTVGGGGRAKFPAGTYKINSLGTQYGDAYSYLTMEGDGPSTLFKNGVSNAASSSIGIFGFYGSVSFSLKQMRFKNFRISGLGASDFTRLLVIDKAENVHFEDIYLENNASEGIVSIIGEQSLRRVSFVNCHAYKTGQGTGLAAINLNAQFVTMMNCSFDSCGNGFENQGHFSSISNCQFMNMETYGIMVQSTWSGYLNPDTGYTQVNTFGATITGCTFSNYNGRGIHIPDFTGHTNTDVVHTSPAHLDGGLGKILITSCLFDRVLIGAWGGSDKLGEIECSTNIFSGQFDSGTGPQAYPIVTEAGTWNIRNNTFTQGKGIQWQGLVGLNVFQQGKWDRVTITDNNVVNLCWAGLAAFRLNQDSTIKGTRFLDLDGTLAAAASNTLMYTAQDSYSNTICELRKSEWNYTDPVHQVCMGTEPTILPVLDNNLPALFSFKPGDTLTNKGNGVNWFTKKCVTGGTVNPTPLAITATGTSGASTITVSATTGLMQYGWIYFPAVPAITPKRITTTPGTTTITLNGTLEATVPGGTAVSWSPPVFVTDRDINTLSIASQATGDTFYASSTTALARLGAGTDGTALTMASGIPAWVDSQPRYDAGNSSTAITITRTPVRQEQKVTLSAATPVITIASVPVGGYLILDVFQDGTGSRAPTWATAISGGLVWVGGAAPTITITATMSDRLLFHNDGSRLVGSVVWQNL